MDRVLQPASYDFRSYRTQDLDAVHALDVECFAPPFRFSRAVMRRCAEAPGALTRLAWAPVAGQDGRKLAGFCIAQNERVGQERVAYVVTLDVAMAFRGQGLGRRLLADVEMSAFQAGACRAALHVSVDNLAAISLYMRLGYSRLQREVDFYGRSLDAFAYEKTLVAGPDGESAPPLTAGVVCAS